MRYETSVVYVEQLPKLVLETGFDWPTFWSFSATVVIFLLGTYLTVRNFNKTIKSQEKVASRNFDIQNNMIISQELIAKQNSLKQSRQNWINDLRNTCALFISESMNVQRLNVFWESAQPTYNLHQINNPELAHQMQADWASSHVQAMKELVSLKAKIDLLLNPDEVDSKELMKVVNELFAKCDQAGGPAKELAVQVVWWCQQILKEEWEKAKAGK